MDEHYISVNLGNDRTLYVAPQTDRRIALSGQEIANEAGYFLFEKRGSDEFARVDIIAQVLSEDAAFRLREIFKMD